MTDATESRQDNRANRKSLLQPQQSEAEKLDDDNQVQNQTVAASKPNFYHIATPSPVDTQTTRTIYIDIHDLVEYAEHNSTLSGIQRVVGGLLWNVSAWCKENPSVNIVPVIPDYDRFLIFAVDTPLVTVMVEMLEAPKGDRTVLDSAIRAVYVSQRRVDPGAGDVFVMAGAFWLCPHYVMMVELRGRGVQFGLFIHDLIQIKNPEYVHHEATLTFRKSLIDALTAANFVLTNSEFVAQEVRTFLREQLNFSLPVRAVVLATELHRVSDTDGVIEPNILKVSRGDYVLCVGTIEVRKNHWYLIKIWERLIKEFEGRIPDLVFVGKWGWDIDALRNYLKQDPLGRRLQIFNSASDVELAHLYKHCLLTTYPSFAEGFGLPVGESLAYGKPCIASNATSIPEVGENFARYIDPHDLNQGYQVFRDILSNRPAIETWTANILANYKPKTWAEFSNEFFSGIVDLASNEENSNRNSNCILETKQFYFIGNDDILRLNAAEFPLVTFRMGCIYGWHPFESWGCWASERDARVKFGTHEKRGTKMSLLVLLHVPPGSKNVVCVVRVGGVENRLKHLTSEGKWCLVEGPVSDDGTLDVTFLSIGRFGRPDHRDLYIGIQSLAYCPKEDLQTRMFFRKKIAFASAGSIRRKFSRYLSALASATGEFNKEKRRRENRLLVEQIIAEREAAAAARPIFYHVKQTRQSSGPNQILLPNSNVVSCREGPYMAAANCLARDFYHERYAAFCRSISHPPYLHRELWEYAFVVEHLNASGVLRPGNKGKVFGVGLARLPSLFAKLGCHILITDPQFENARQGSSLWSQQAPRDQLFYSNICDWEEFDARVSFAFTDMKPLNASFRGYDFCWSSCKANKLGSITNGIDFIVESVEKTLKIGGTACHTGEFNLTSNEETIEFGETVLFRRNDIENMVERLEQRGHKVKYLPIEAGMSFLDCLVDVPPYGAEAHMKIQLGDFVATSFGIVVTRGR